MWCTLPVIWHVRSGRHRPRRQGCTVNQDFGSKVNFIWSVADEVLRDDFKRGKYEINFNRYFYQYEPPRPLAETDAEIKALETEIAAMLREVTE